MYFCKCSLKIYPQGNEKRYFMSNHLFACKMLDSCRPLRFFFRGFPFRRSDQPCIRHASLSRSFKVCWASPVPVCPNYLAPKMSQTQVLRIAHLMYTWLKWGHSHLCMSRILSISTATGSQCGVWMSCCALELLERVSTYVRCIMSMCPPVPLLPWVLQQRWERECQRVAPNM